MVVYPSIYERFRPIVRLEPFLLVRGRLENDNGVTNVLAGHVAPLRVPRDFNTPLAKNFG